MRACNHGCDVTLSDSPADFKAVSPTLNYKYLEKKKKKTFPSFDLGIDYLFPSMPEERKQKKEEQQRLLVI